MWTSKELTVIALNRCQCKAFILTYRIDYYYKERHYAKSNEKKTIQNGD